MTINDKFSVGNILANGGSINATPDELLELAWPSMSARARKNVVASWTFTGKPLPDFMRASK